LGHGSYPIGRVVTAVSKTGGAIFTAIMAVVIKENVEVYRARRRGS
jgi:hypothetical protein